MAATLSLDTITSSGSTITVPTGKTMAITDAGNLTIGGVAITTGAQGVLSKTATYPIVAGDFTGKSSLIVFVDVSAGTGTAADITLPAAADFGTCAIHVVSTAAHGSGNSIVIKLGAVEQYTLYGKGDHCELVSDGTNVFRTGNEYVTLRGYVCATADLSVAANTHIDVWDGMTYTEEEDLGGNWSTVTDDFTAPFDGEYMFQGDCKYGNYFIGYNLKKNGTYLAGTHTNDHYGGDANVNNYPVPLVAGDVIQYWITNTYGSSDTLYGNASASAARMRADWWCVRRY